MRIIPFLVLLFWSLSGCGYEKLSDDDFAKRGDLEKLKKSLSKAEDISKDKLEYLLYLGAANGHIEIVKHLLTKVSSLNNKNLNPLHVSVRNEYLNITKLLVSSGANVNFKNSEGDPVLHMTALNKEADILNFLLVNGCYPDEIDNRRFTTLHKCKSPSVAKALISHGANVNFLGKENFTPLHYIAFNRQIVNPQVVRHLIESGANIHSKSVNGRTPLQLAQKNEQFKLVELLNELSN
jgi:ankyrin repeat protein